MKTFPSRGLASVAHTCGSGSAMNELYVHTSDLPRNWTVLRRMYRRARRTEAALSADIAALYAPGVDMRLFEDAHRSLALTCSYRRRIVERSKRLDPAANVRREGSEGVVQDVRQVHGDLEQ